MDKETYKSSFKSLLEITDKYARNDLSDYYIVNTSRMNNFLHCLEDGAKKINSLTEDRDLWKESERKCNEYAKQLLEDNERLREKIKEARDYRTPMGNSIGAWFKTIQRILEEALTPSKEKEEWMKRDCRDEGWKHE